MKLNRDILRQLPLALRIEIEENAQCKQLTQSELAHEQRRILEELRKHKTPGKRTDLKGGRATSGKDLPQVHATAVVGKLYGESRTQVEKRQAVVDAVAADDMDRTGRVNGVFKRLRVAKQAEAIRAEPPPLPRRGPYRVITADPGWPYERDDSGDPSHRAALPYLTTKIAEACKLPVASIAAKDCILWLWVTNHHMREAFAVLDAWGFEQKTILTWVKDKFGYGDWLRGQTEHCLIATRGNPIVTLSNQSTVLFAPMRGHARPPRAARVARRHSQKPVEFYDFVEKLCPAPRYAELFSRYRHSDRWDCHGDEAPDASGGAS